MQFFLEYMGMSYEQASLEGEQLIKKAAETGEWFSIIDRLSCLRDQMEREARRQAERLARAAAREATHV